MTIVPYPDSDPSQQILNTLGDPADPTSRFTQFSGALQETLRRLKYAQSFPGVSSGVGNSNGYSGNAYSGATPGSAPGSSPSGSSTPDYGSLLRMYGVNQPDIRQSPIFSNDFMSAHPRLGGALNNALVSMALTPEARGPEGFGGGLSRTLQGVIGVQPYMAQFQHAQEMYPIERVEALAKLFGTQAQTDMYRAHAQYFQQMPGERLESAQLRYLAAQNKLGQPVHSADGRLLGYIGADGFQSTQSLGIPEDASVNKPGSQTPRYNIEAYTSALVNGEMQKRYGADQSKWPSTPMDVWQGAISEAQKQFKVLPQEAINANRQIPGDDHWRATTQLTIQRMLDGEQARINSRYDRIVNQPLVKFNDKLRDQNESQRQAELQDAQQRAQQLQDTLLGPQQSPSKRSPKSRANAASANAANVPPRPDHVPDDYVFNANGPQGRGWYAPNQK